jgi:hypothetical protein
MLADGVAGAALHPIIRLGHAVHDQNTQEVIAALAYWAWAYQALPWPAQPSASARDPETVLQNLRQNKSWPTEAELDRPTITEEFNNLVSLPMYQTLAMRLEAGVLSLPVLQQLAIRLFWMHDDFILLHGVTATQALGRIAPLLAQPEVLFEPIWKAIIIGWLVKDLHWQQAMPVTGEPTLSLVQIKTLAAHALNDHTIKLVAACLDGYKNTGDKHYWFAAQRRVLTDKQTAQMIG